MSVTLQKEAKQKGLEKGPGICLVNTKFSSCKAVP